MKRGLLRLLARVTAGESAQRQLARMSAIAGYLRGLGSGADVESSGEAVALRGIPVDAVVLDVGANDGAFALEVLRTLARARLHCFEPSTAAFESLTRAVGGRGVALNNFALSSAAGSAELFGDAQGSVLASLTRRDLEHLDIATRSLEVVRLQTLDDYCLRERLEFVDLLKIDVEGHELEVLRGATRMFEERRVRRVMFEFGGCNIDSRTYFRDFHRFFSAAGMTSLGRVTPSGRLHRVLRYSEDLENFSTSNYVVDFGRD